MSNLQLIWITGVINFVSIALVLLTCRCMMARFPGVTNSKLYNALNRYHCAYWIVFVLSIAAHGVLEFLTFGLPF